MAVTPIARKRKYRGPPDIQEFMVSDDEEPAGSDDEFVQSDGEDDSASSAASEESVHARREGEDPRYPSMSLEKRLTVVDDNEDDTSAAYLAGSDEELEGQAHKSTGGEPQAGRQKKRAAEQKAADQKRRLRQRDKTKRYREEYPNFSGDEDEDEITLAERAKRAKPNYPPYTYGAQRCPSEACPWEVHDGQDDEEVLPGSLRMPKREETSWIAPVTKNESQPENPPSIAPVPTSKPERKAFISRGRIAKWPAPVQGRVSKRHEKAAGVVVPTVRSGRLEKLMTRNERVGGVMIPTVSRKKKV